MLIKGTVTAAAEIAGKAVFGNGLASQVRPRKYLTIRKESLERFLDDVEQLINFVVIEFQRIVFVENIWVTVAVRDPFQKCRVKPTNFVLTRPSHRPSLATG